MNIVKGQVYKDNLEGKQKLLVTRVTETDVYAIDRHGTERVYFKSGDWSFESFWTLDEDAAVTRIVFKLEKDSKTDVVAFLLDVPANWGYVMSYAHVGQHSEASIIYARECKPANKSQYKDLKAELESIGYFVIPVRKLIRINNGE